MLNGCYDFFNLSFWFPSSFLSVKYKNQNFLTWGIKALQFPELSNTSFHPQLCQNICHCIIPSFQNSFLAQSFDPLATMEHNEFMNSKNTASSDGKLVSYLLTQSFQIPPLYDWCVFIVCPLLVIRAFCSTSHNFSWIFQAWPL